MNTYKRRIIVINIRRIALLIMCFSATVSATAQTGNWFEENVNWNLYTVFTPSVLKLEDKPFGKKFPVNGFTDLSNEEYDLEFRLNINMDFDDCKVKLKPRVRTTYYNDLGPLEGTYQTQTFFNTAMARCRLNRATELSVGRQRFQWGNSQFRSPSNPFFPETILFNPTDELIGKDFAIMNYRPDFNWEFSTIVNYGESHIDNPPNPKHEFINTYGVKVEYTSNSYHLGGLISQRDDKPIRLNGFGNYTVNRALLLYGELTASKDAMGLLVDSDELGNLTGFNRAQDVDDKMRYTTLIGGSYTFLSGLTAYIEYIHGTEGFNNRQAQAWQQAGAYAVELWMAGQRLESTPILTDAIDPLWRQLRQNYLVLQLSRTQYNNNLDVALQYVANLDDHGSTLAASIVYQPTDSLELFLVANKNFGGGDTEFGRLIKSVFQVGVRFYIF